VRRCGLERRTRCGAGAIASRAIREGADRELAGVFVHDPTDVGCGAGELAATAPLRPAASAQSVERPPTLPDRAFAGVG
jgi:hypothetical protein